MLYSNAIDSYRAVAKVYSPLTKKEEVKLLRRAQKGDTGARDLLVKHNLNLIIYMSLRHKSSGLPFEDLIQEGMAGFVKAIDKFDLNQKVKLSTYANWWVNANIMNYMRVNMSPVKLAPPKPGGEPVRAPRAVLLSAPASANSDDEVGDRLVDAAPLSDERHEENERRELVWRVARGIREFGPVGRDIMKERILSDDPTTLKVIGERHGISRERVRQIEVDIRDVMKKRLLTYAATA